MGGIKRHLMAWGIAAAVILLGVSAGWAMVTWPVIWMWLSIVAGVGLLVQLGYITVDAYSGKDDES